ncbi:MAG: YMGG-like glycine zipper-containing protein [Bryobacteraceae bacterium]
MKRTIAATLVLVALAGCGYSTGERALSGAGIGAAVGAVGGAIIGGDPVTGAAVGAGVGAATGALTSPDDVNFDRR